MASIDERVVAMSFENTRFEARVATTMGTLSKLNSTLANIGKVNGLNDIEKSGQKVTLSGPMAALDRLKAKLGFGGAGRAFSDLEGASRRARFEGPASALDRIKGKLRFPGAHKAFADVQASSAKVTLAEMGTATETVSAKFGAMQIAAGAALGTIVSKATSAAAELGKGFSVGPISQGMEEYGLKLSAVQTIMSSTGEKQKPVVKALQELNKYSDRTIYSFKDMITNIPKFTNAGVKLKPAVKAIQGIAQVAAVAGASTEEASRAMFNFGQAMATGSVRAIDWRSIDLANMGTVQFKQQLIDTGVAMGTLKKQGDGTYKTLKGTTVTAKQFTEGLQDQWLTSKVLTTTLAKYTDEQTRLGKNAFKSATDIKTLGQFMDVLKESIGSGWAASFENIFGNLDEAKKLWGGVNDVIGKFINNTSNARNKVLSDWKAMGGRTELIKGIGAAFRALMSVIKPLKDAFRDVFPRKTGEDLYNMTVNFRKFMEGLRMGPETADALRRTFAGFFAVLHIGWSVVKGVLGVIGKLLGLAGKGSGGFLNLTGSVGDFLVALDKAITKGGLLTTFFESLGSVITVPMELLKALGNVLSDLFGGGDGGGADKFAQSMETVRKGAGPLAGVIDALVVAWNGLVKILEKVKEAVSPLLEDIGEVFGNFGDTIADAIKGADYDKVMAAVQTTLVGGIFLTLKKAIAGGVGVDFGQGMLEKLGKTFEHLTGSLKAMQQNLQAGTLLKIAGAIGLLAVGVLLLSTIEPKKLATAMAAVAVGLGQLVFSMSLLSKVAPMSMITMPFIAAALVGLATAVVVLAGAVKIFSTLSWEELIKGLAGVGGALTAVGLGVKLIGPGVIPAALAIGLLAVGINALAVAVKIFSTLSWGELIKGLVGVTAAIAGIGVAMTLMPPSILITAGGVLLLSVAMIALSGAIRSFGSMNLFELGKGIWAASVAIRALGMAAATIPPTIAFQAAGLVVLGIALTSIGVAVGILGKMDLWTLVKGIAALGATLVVLAVGLTAMSGTVMGSVALLGAAAALAVLAPTLGLFGVMPWKVIIKGLAAIALTLGTIAVVGLIAAPALLALGVALIALGAGMSAISVAIYILAKGLSLLSAEGSKGLGVLIAAMTAFIAAIPLMVISFVKGLVTIVAEIAKVAPKLVESLVKIVKSMLDAVIQAAPKIAQAAVVLIMSFLRVINASAGPLITAGWRLFMNFLKGIADNIGRVVSLGATIIIRFLQGLASATSRLVSAGIRVLVNFLVGVTAGLPRIIAQGARMIGAFLVGITRAMPGLIVKGGKAIRTFLNGVAREMPKTIASGVRVVVAFIRGVGDALPRIIRAGVRVAVKFINGIAEAGPRLARAGFRAVINFLNGTADAIRDNDDQMIRAGGNIASAIGTGLMKGLAALAGQVTGAAGGLAKKLLNKVISILGIASPSKEFIKIGMQTMEGMVVGLRSGSSAVISTVENAANNVVDAAKSTLSKVPSILDGLTDMNPVITPVLDLSNVVAGAKQIGDLTNVVPITAAASYGQAVAISDQQTASQAAQVVQAPSTEPLVKLEQNNYSPKALSDVEIYRQTKNQLSQVKNALGLVS